MIFEIESWPLKVRFWQSIEYLEMVIFGQLFDFDPAKSPSTIIKCCFSLKMHIHYTYLFLL